MELKQRPFPFGLAESGLLIVLNGIETLLKISDWYVFNLLIVLNGIETESTFPLPLVSGETFNRTKWNWNNAFTVAIIWLSAFNRTKMELKWHQRHHHLQGNPPFNRTKWNFWDAAFPESTFVSLTGSFAFLYCCFYLSFRKCLLMLCYGIKIMEQLRL